MKDYTQFDERKLNVLYTKSNDKLRELERKKTNIEKQIEQELLNKRQIAKAISAKNSKTASANLVEKAIVEAENRKIENKTEVDRMAREAIKNYKYVEKLETKSERQLKTMLDTLEKKATRIKAKISKLEYRFKEKIRRTNLTKIALIERQNINE